MASKKNNIDEDDQFNRRYRKFTDNKNKMIELGIIKAR